MHITALARNTLPTDTPFPASHPDQKLITEYLEMMRPAGAPRQPQPVTNQSAPQALHTNIALEGRQDKRMRQAHKEPTLHRDKARKRQSLHRETVNDQSVRQPTVGRCPALPKSLL